MAARAGIIGGVIGGILKLVLDQLTFAAGISSVDTVGEFSRLLFGGAQAGLATITVYLILTGLVGWLVASLLADTKLDSYIVPGIIVGVLGWAIMNIILSASGVVTPTWSLGAGTFVVNLITHAILGISITFALVKYASKAATTA